MPKVTLTLNDEMYQQGVGQSLACGSSASSLEPATHQRVERDKAHILHYTTVMKGNSRE